MGGESSSGFNLVCFHIGTENGVGGWESLAFLILEQEGHQGVWWGVKGVGWGRGCVKNSAAIM